MALGANGHIASLDRFADTVDVDGGDFHYVVPFPSRVYDTRRFDVWVNGRAARAVRRSEDGSEWGGKHAGLSARVH